MMHEGSIRASEGQVFFRHWLRSPKSMGSIIPSSRVLARAIAAETDWQPGETIVELGGGTGAITEGLIERGVPRDNLLVIELEDHLAGYLKQRLEGCRVVQGDATRLAAILEREGIERVSTVISGLPMVGMPFDFQKAIIENGFAAMKPGSFMLQYSYSPISPVPQDKLGIKAELVRYVWRNVPPAAVWRYTRLAPAG